MVRKYTLKILLFRSIKITCKCFGICALTFPYSKIVNLKSIDTNFHRNVTKSVYNELKAGPFEATKWPTNPEKLI